MARPLKTPLSYFPFATGFPNDEKILIIAGEFGAKGEAIVVRLWCALYGTYGYYLPYDELNTPPTIARVDDRRYGVSATLVVAIVNRCLQVGIFNAALYKEYSILTSQAIQERYFHAVHRRRGVTAVRQYLLITPPVGIVIIDINPINVDNNELNNMKDNIFANAHILSSTERENKFLYNNSVKEKEKKEKESSSRATLPLQTKCDRGSGEAEGVVYSPPASIGGVASAEGVQNLDRSIARSLDRSLNSILEIFFFNNFSNPSGEVQRFINHYNSRGWRDASGTQLHDIPSLAMTWEQRKSKRPHNTFALDAFRMFYAAFCKDISIELRVFILRGITAITVNDNNEVIISCTRDVAQQLEQIIQSHLKQAQRCFSSFKSINYKLITNR